MRQTKVKKYIIYNNCIPFNGASSIHCMILGMEKHLLFSVQMKGTWKSVLVLKSA